MSVLERMDPEIWGAVQREIGRQKSGLELIASENYTSAAVLEAAGTVLTNKYAEGYPGRRYYGGCEFIDTVEELARQRARALFGSEHANVQPHAGSQANMAVYLTVLKPGDTYLAMNLAHGGHLTHGSPVNFSGQLYNVVAYGVRESDHRIDFDHVVKMAREHKPKLIVAGRERMYPRRDRSRQVRRDRPFRRLALLMDHRRALCRARCGGGPQQSRSRGRLRNVDFAQDAPRPAVGVRPLQASHAKRLDKTIFPGMQGGPLEHIIAGKAVCFSGEAMQPSFKEYGRQIVANSKALAETLMQGGIRLASGGTDNHLMLCDMTAVGLTGRYDRRSAPFDKAAITVNKNMIPYDQPQKPLGPSTASASARLRRPLRRAVTCEAER